MRSLDQITDEICGIVADDGRFRSDILRILEENLTTERRELQDWRELSEAVASLPMPKEWRQRSVWPNDWHQDCAAVAYMIYRMDPENT